MSAPDLERLAAEHVMGLLEGEEALTAEKLLAQDTEFAAMVDDWRSRLGELDETAPREQPSAGLWSRIEADLPAQSIQRAAASTPVPMPGLWQSLRFWRAMSLAGACAAVLLGLALTASLREQARKPVLIAVLMSDANQAAAVVNAFADGRTELLPLADIAVPPGRALQVWTLWDRQRGPVSVGLMDRARRLDLTTGSLPRAAPDQLFEITLEPATGSPTGRPTGPVLMKGTASQAL